MNLNEKNVFDAGNLEPAGHLCYAFILVEKKKRICGRLHFFMLKGQKYDTGILDPEKTPRHLELSNRGYLTLR